MNEIKQKKSDEEIKKKLEELLKSCKTEAEFRERCRQEFREDIVRDIKVSGWTKFEATRAVNLYLADRSPIYVSISV